MNIFFLHLDQHVAVRWYVDAHIRKMMLECLEMLRHAAAFVDQPYDCGYALSRRHANHPCTIWTQSGYENLKWHHDLGLAIYDEWRWRFKTTHKTGQHLTDFPIHSVGRALRNKVQSKNLAFPALAFGPWKDLCCHGLTMTTIDDHIRAYRRYYVNAKPHLHKWTNRPEPEWFESEFIPHIVSYLDPQIEDDKCVDLHTARDLGRGKSVPIMQVDLL